MTIIVPNWSEINILSKKLKFFFQTQITMNQSQRAQINFHSKNLKFTVSTKKDKNRQYIFLHQPNFMGVFNILVFVYGAKLVFEKQIDLKKTRNVRKALSRFQGHQRRKKYNINSHLWRQLAPLAPNHAFGNCWRLQRCITPSAFVQIKMVKMVLLEDQNDILHFDFAGHLFIFRARIIHKIELLKAENNS